MWDPVLSRPHPSSPNDSGRMIPQKCDVDVARSTLPPYLVMSHDHKPYWGPQPEVCYPACLFSTLPYLQNLRLHMLPLIVQCPPTTSGATEDTEAHFPHIQIFCK